MFQDNKNSWLEYLVDEVIILRNLQEIFTHVQNQILLCGVR